MRKIVILALQKANTFKPVLQRDLQERRRRETEEIVSRCMSRKIRFAGGYQNPCFTLKHLQGFPAMTIDDDWRPCLVANFAQFSSPCPRFVPRNELLGHKKFRTQFQVTRREKCQRPHDIYVLQKIYYENSAASHHCIL